MIRLRKSGIDVSGMPRKTTNIFERFQESMKAFTESSSSSEDSNVLKSAFKSSSGSTSDEVPGEERSRSQQVGDPVDMMQVTAAEGEQQRRRRTKREVLESRSVDIEQVLLLLACSCSCSVVFAATLTHVYHIYYIYYCIFIYIFIHISCHAMDEGEAGHREHVAAVPPRWKWRCLQPSRGGGTYFTHWCLSV